MPTKGHIFGAAEFWAKVQKSVSSSACWIWQGTMLQSGYGRCRLNGKTVRAHRAAYELEIGPIPAEMCVCHRCDQPRCVNAKHAGGYTASGLARLYGVRVFTIQQILSRATWQHV